MKRAGKANLCLWAFDLLSLNGAVPLDKPLLGRRQSPDRRVKLTAVVRARSGSGILLGNRGLGMHDSPHGLRQARSCAQSPIVQKENAWLFVAHVLVDRDDVDAYPAHGL